DDRGFFLESYNAKVLASAGVTETLVQDNHSRSNKGVLRGIHFQHPPHAQAKLVRVARGRVFDVAVDLRKNSPTFGLWAGCELSDRDHHQLYIPAGFGHGFLVLEDQTDFLYKTSDFYQPSSEGAVAWNDPELAIDWPLAEHGITAPLLSDKDKQAPLLKDANLPAP
ncbi:MAG: dTDP-4-dehydrorhamnose 3,5-epimerase, partial [Burkholderiaceae bacterium]